MPAEVEIAVGMRTMVLFNIATEADMANGTRGAIVDIRLDPRESNNPQVDEDGKTRLRYPPALVLFRPDIPSSLRFSTVEESIEPGVVPLTPSKISFYLDSSDDSEHRVRITRHQYALTPAYAFTDYKSQGQTLARVIVDLASPPDKGSPLTALSVYVALSRVSSRDNIRILRDFDDKILDTPLHPDLIAEDTRLQDLWISTVKNVN